MITLTKTRRIWSVEDMNEYTYYSAHSRRLVMDYINNDPKIREHPDGYLVCEYPQSDSLVPDHVSTVKTFMLNQYREAYDEIIDIEKDN